MHVYLILGIRLLLQTRYYLCTGSCSLKAMHGGKAKNDKIDSSKIARLIHSGMLPQAYVYPGSMRATRDLL